MTLPQATKWKSYAFGFAVFAITVAVFSGIAGHDWVVWDDDIHFYGNPNYLPVTPTHLARFWTASYEGLYIPLFYTLMGLLSLTARIPAASPLTDTGAVLNPHVFHITSILLHGMNTALVFALLRRMTRKDIPSALGALLFGLHPFQVESVAWASELRGLTSAFFVLLSIHFALPADPEMPRPRARHGFMIVGAVVTGICAYLCKPSSVVLPALIASVAATRRRSWRAGIREVMPIVIPLTVAAIVLSVVARQSQLVTGYSTVIVWERPFIAGDALCFYLYKFVLPFGLGLDYGRSPKHVMEQWWRSLTWVAPAVFAAIAFELTKTFPAAKRWVGPSLLFSLGSLLPVLGFVPFVFQGYSTVADRYAYLAMIGAALALAGLTAALDDSRRPAAVKTAWPMMCCVWLIVLAGASFTLIPSWSNTGTLALHTLNVNPGSVPGDVLEERAQQIDARLRR